MANPGTTLTQKRQRSEQGILAALAVRSMNINELLVYGKVSIGFQTQAKLEPLLCDMLDRGLIAKSVGKTKFKDVALIYRLP